MAPEFLSEGTEEKSGTWEVMIAAWCLNLAMTRIFVGLFNANMTHSCLHQWICGRDLWLGRIYLRQAWSGLQTELYFVRIIEVSNKYPIDLVWSRKYLSHNYFIKNSGTLAYIVLGFVTNQFSKKLKLFWETQQYAEHLSVSEPVISFILAFQFPISYYISIGFWC